MKCQMPNCNQEAIDTIFQYCKEHTKEREKAKYTIEITEEDNEYKLSAQKHYGNSSGILLSQNSKEETLETIKATIKRWERYDTIIQRKSDRVTEKNTFLCTHIPEITIADITGNEKLTKFLT